MHKFCSVPVNKNATKEARELLKYIVSQAGKKIITGQHTQTNPMEEREYIKEVTGYYPKLVEFELLSYSPNIQYEDASEACLTEVYENQGTVDTAIALAKEQDIIPMICFHWFSPLYGRDKSFYTEHTDFDPGKVLESHSEERTAFFKDLDCIAEQLKKFKDANIPILFRPLHEVEGTWFWWGSKGGAVAKELYYLVFDYFVKEKQLSNILWVWSSPTKESYPGDDFCDVVGWDIYPSEKQWTDYKEQYEELTKNTSANKVKAITEVSYNPDIHKLEASHIPWAFYMTWSKEFAMDSIINTKEELREMYHSTYSIKL